MRTIYKYELPIQDGLIPAKFPRDAKILHVGQQSDRYVCLWVELDPTEKDAPRLFRIYGTGHPLQHEQGEYVGTVLDNQNKLVWHVYEVP